MRTEGAQSITTRCRRRCSRSTGRYTYNDVGVSTPERGSAACVLGVQPIFGKTGELCCKHMLYRMQRTQSTKRSIPATAVMHYMCAATHRSQCSHNFVLHWPTAPPLTLAICRSSFSTNRYCPTNSSHCCWLMVTLWLLAVHSMGKPAWDSSAYRRRHQHQHQQHSGSMYSVQCVESRSHALLVCGMCAEGRQKACSCEQHLQRPVQTNPHTQTDSKQTCTRNCCTIAAHQRRTAAYTPPTQPT